METKVSIIIPIYNMEKSIADCVHSISRQTYNNIEIVLVDDGSTDRSFQICTELAKQDDRIRVIHTDNQGSGPARNEGIMAASGGYMYFPDADDYIVPDTIEHCVEEIEKENSDLLVFGYDIYTRAGKKLYTKKYDDVNVDGEILRNDYRSALLQNEKYYIQGAPWNKFFKTSVIRNNTVFYPSLRRHQDEAFIARYMTHVKNVRFSSCVLYKYYENDLSNQWRKFPTDYIDCVIGLLEDRKNNILSWNTNDVATREIVYSTYFSKVIVALEQAYSPKYCFNREQRISFERGIIGKAYPGDFKFDFALGKYQSLVLGAILDNNQSKLDFLIGFKVLFEKSGILNIKRYLLNLC